MSCDVAASTESEASGAIAITVSGIGKHFRLYDRPQDRLLQGFLRHRTLYEEFWALRDVSFSVNKGETVGIIGQNGSGKSTLLQIIAGIVAPTTGSVDVGGRVMALLELGSGFDPEFTGRENVFVNGAILGFSRARIEELFPEISEFASIGAFIDQPVRTYSTGMVIRLAFAVQVFLPKDVLIVDEVLAVGDEAFQRRCYAKIEEFRAAGGTILFVSHSAGLVVQLCSRAVLLDRGELILQGRSKNVVNMYQRLLHAPADLRDKQRDQLKELGKTPDWERGVSDVEPGDDIEANVAVSRGEFDEALVSPGVVKYEPRGARIEHVRLSLLDGTPVNVLRPGQRYLWRYSVAFDCDSENVRFGMLIKTVSGLELGGAASVAPGSSGHSIAAGERIEVAFEFVARLAAGTYFLNAGLVGATDDGETFLTRWVDAALFKVLPDEEGRVTGFVDFGIDCRWRPR
jgi:lipopolysaccharide transport system ATP-binding protein